MTGFTLPGMIEDPGCRSGMCSSPRPAFGPEPIQRRSFEIFVRLTASDLSAPEASTRPSRAPCASKWSAASTIGSPVVSARIAITFGGEAGRGVDAGAGRGAAERHLREPRHHRRDPVEREPDLAGVAAELLAEGDRRRVHQVRAAGLHELRPRGRLLLERDGEVLERGDSTVCTASVAARCTEVGKTSFDDWEALTSSFGCTGRPRRAVASEASTSFMFMFEEVPLPVW